MHFQFFVLFSIFLIEYSSSKDPCDSQYLLWYTNHTMCQPINSTCTILQKGITQEDKDQILRLHNEFRSKVASGKETRAGGMPNAADMLEMTWDDELAKVAQRHAETCVFKHDCKECRALKHFMVGQNIGIHRMPHAKNGKEMDWKKSLTSLYDEVAHFNNRNVGSYVFSKTYGHFTQIIWSKTWRIGCGWVLYKDEEYDSGYFVCNYGPQGNVQGGEVYKAGSTCSSCPKNSCCGEACKKFNITSTFEGLCKVIDEKEPPTGFGPLDSDDLVYCDFHGQKDCEKTTEEKGDWELVKTINGNWIHIALNGGETARMKMNSKFKNPSGTFCFRIFLRYGALEHGGSSSVKAKVTFETVHGRTLKMDLKGIERFKFNPYRITINMDTEADVKATLQFSVPDKVPPQFIDIKKISVKGRKCD